MPLRPAVTKRRLAKADPREQPLHEPCSLRQAHQDIHYSPVQQAEISSIGRNRYVGNTVEHAVKITRREAPQNTFAIAAETGCIHYIEAFTPLRNHLFDQFRRVL